MRVLRSQPSLGPATFWTALLAADAAHANLCASCDGMSCGAGACISDGGNVYCYY